MKYSEENVIARNVNEFSSPGISYFFCPMQSCLFLVPEAFMFIVLIVLYFLIKK
jgi:hypothetical protein